MQSAVTRRLPFKSRTGCITCKVRRVKCDESKPHCRRCVTSGRNCDGYVPVIPAANSSSSRNNNTRTSPTSIQFSSPSENELLCFWSASRLTDIFGCESFWKTSLHPLALQYPAIQYALVALKSAWEAPKSYMKTIEDTYTLQSYNKAIHQINRGLSFDSTQDLYSVLVACAIFVCLEFIRGFPKEALRHVLSGIHILNERNMLDLLDVRMQRNEAQAEELNDLTAIFGRLRIASINFDKSLTPYWTPENFLGRKRVVFSEFTSLQHAKEVYAEIYAAAFSLLTAASKLGSDSFFELAVKQHHVSTNIANWLSEFTFLMEDNMDEWSAEEIKLARHAKMSALIHTAWIATCLSPYQCSLDNYTEHFVEVLDLAEATINDGLISSFQVDKGIIPIIHYVGIKCRDRRIRRRALKLLRAQYWREGYYDSDTSYRIMYRQIAWEETNIARFKDPTLLPREEDRITGSMMEGVLDITPDNQVLRLKLIARPDGPMEKPTVWVEEINLVGDLPLLSDIDAD